ncbi:CRM-domain containing factor CFM3, chloroplastic/mitochondrial [Cornus florida]|uniref:CRM-domain containing factor CFM3, chloroplastic/mitochondrial n=1 Tax=Cornus florida TaxID=4283 RepID=UPI00289E5B69|nr:CRM-domain containing factor CFM3, chloroplastic/mitochondrial [Cornus florida]
MVLTPFPLNLYSPSSTCSSSPSLYFLSHHSQTQSSISFIALKFRPSCSHHNAQLDTRQFNPTKKKRKPKPSFFEEIRDKWSVKPTSLREKLPWQEQEQREPIKEVQEQSLQFSGSELEAEKKSPVSDPVSFGSSIRIISPPWIHGSNPKKTQFDFETRNPQDVWEKGEIINEFGRNSKNKYHNVGQESKNLERGANYNGECKERVQVNSNPVGLQEEEEEAALVGADNGVLFDGKSSKVDGEFHSFEGSDDRDSTWLPWKTESDMKSVEGERLRNSSTKLAEELIPENELKRLRNVALRMVERIKVGAAGITQELVDSIHEKWKVDEVVKLKFEGPPAMNMRRTHEILESRTGGLVIWRSGSSVVLYRGMTYKLDCVQSYTEQNLVDLNNSHSSREFVHEVTQRVEFKGSVRTTESMTTGSVRSLKDLSEKELMDLSELNYLLDELGPRFKDWSGRDPPPVDADLLPAVVPGYKTPFRLLPYRIRQGLRDKEMTYFRRTARTMPPHFALGRNRELQGLAMAMVKLWERSAIAKIAIKRGVQNTCNERMAEELKILTGGTLLSRNKDYIVFYRGNDFLPPVVTETLEEAQKLTALRQDDEEQTRQNASMIYSNAKAAKGPLVAGTLAETMAATSRWGNQPSSEDIEKMMRDSALARHASLVRYLEMKLALAKGKFKRAEKALEKVQECLEPADLPTDLETISDEERFLFRKMGLSMKPFLPLGRRGIFDGTIENMHLHWKYRELVKIIVERKSFPQVKQIAISLEAESGGILVSVDKTTKGYVIIVYRGKNYQRPDAVRPKNLLTKRQALARSVELQRREALKHHILDLQERFEKLKTELEKMKNAKEIDEETFNSRMDNAYSSDDEMGEDDGEESFLGIYDSEHEDGNI